jgi:hypothetical protein
MHVLRKQQKMCENEILPYLEAESQNKAEIDQQQRLASAMSYLYRLNNIGGAHIKLAILIM